MDTDTLMVALQQIGSSPQIGAAYNVGPLFSYLMKVKGADISPFEKSPQQVAYEQAVNQWQQLIMQMIKANPNIDPKQYPPQPTPQQYGYDPAQQAGSDSSSPPTQVSNSGAGQQQQQQQAPNQQQ
jgi:hypothetical protein